MEPQLTWWIYNWGWTHWQNYWIHRSVEKLTSVWNQWCCSLLAVRNNAGNNHRRLTDTATSPSSKRGNGSLWILRTLIPVIWHIPEVERIATCWTNMCLQNLVWAPPTIYNVPADAYWIHVTEWNQCASMEMRRSTVHVTYRDDVSRKSILIHVLLLQLLFELTLSSFFTLVFHVCHEPKSAAPVSILTLAGKKTVFQ